MPARASTSAAVGKVTQQMQSLKEQKKVAFIPYICAGDPNLETTAKAIKILDEQGADVIELGVPYSDPLADGPTIQYAAQRALEAGTSLQGVLKMLSDVTPSIKAPLILFTYYNVVMAQGIDSFCQSLQEAGVAGLLVPDVPLEETVDIREGASKYGLDIVLLTTPTTPENRMKQIADTTQGFLYLVSITGVTGAKDTVNEKVEGLISTLKAVSDQPVAVGFGVSKPEHAQTLKSWGADGVIVGSRLVKALGEADSPEKGLEELQSVAKALRAAI